MGVEEKLDIIEAYMGREITQEEEATAWPSDIRECSQIDYGK